MSLHAKPNDIHQAHTVYLPHDKYNKNMYKYALNIVDVASSSGFSVDIWKYIINLSKDTDN